MGEKGGKVSPAGDALRAGQGREIHQKIGRFGGGLPQRVGQHQPALGIGIADFYRDALARFQHVLRPVGLARDAVLDRRDQHAQPDI